MSTLNQAERYAKVIEVSKHVRREIERDLIRGRGFDYTKTFLPSQPVARQWARGLNPCTCRGALAASPARARTTT
jgi:hypothetical protein